jgi:N-acylneuraminate cytidylyltransferase
MKAKNLCIIPARGGSKRIPRKNIKMFKGEPIIAYSIKAAIASKLFDEVMVSTDDSEIAEIAISYDASVPFMRSDLNSNDFATTADVLIEVIYTYQNAGQEFDNICCIYPTAPFITSERLIEGFETLNNGADSVITMLSFDYPIWRSFKLNENNCVEYNWNEFINSRSQDLPRTYHDAGQWYWLKCNKLRETGKMVFETTKGLHLSPFEAHDIDSLDDWKLAELKYEFLQSLK